MARRGKDSSSSTSATDCSASDDTNVTIETAYNADGNVSSITAVNAATGNQTTRYIYGTTLADSDVAMSTLKRAVIYPDSDDTDALGDGTDGIYDRIEFKYDRQQKVTEIKDQQGTVHAFEYDDLGREIHDRVTALGSGVDGSVRRISTTYEVRGMKEKLTSYDNATVGSGSIDNEVQFSYNDFGQVNTDYQEHGAAVNTGTSPKVQYGYATGSDNTIRPTTLTYPDGRVLNYNYGSSGDTNDSLSRIASLIDNDGTTHLADYSYLGQRTFIEVDYPQPDLKYTLIGTAGGNDPDTGDIYLGLDRFGRIKDSLWYAYGSSADADRVKYGYDRMGNRTHREQTVDTNSNHDEFYQYDAIDRLKQMDRGTLSAQKDQISSLNFAQCWSLDSTGNWQGFSEDSDGDSTWDLDQTRTANKVNEITDVTETTGPAWQTPVYNRAGNMTTVPKPADPTTAYTATYDPWNRLVKLEDGANTVAEYRYDAAKRRIVKKTYTGGELDETRHLFYTEPSKWQVIEERVDASTDPDRQFIWGQRYIDDLVLRDRDTSDPRNGTLDERLYCLQDANWNVTSVADSSGTIQERYAYDAYGTPRILTSAFTTRASSNHEWETLYAGYRWDGEMAWSHVRHRVLHPFLGWLQRDPIGYENGLNLYEYVWCCPTTAIDTFGLVGWEDNPYKSPQITEPLPPGMATKLAAIAGCLAGAVVGLALEDFQRGIDERGCIDPPRPIGRYLCNVIGGCLAGMSVAAWATLALWGAANPAVLAAIGGLALLGYLALCGLCREFGANAWMCAPVNLLLDVLGL